MSVLVWALLTGRMKLQCVTLCPLLSVRCRVLLSVSVELLIARRLLMRRLFL